MLTAPASPSAVVATTSAPLTTVDAVAQATARRKLPPTRRVSGIRSAHAKQLAAAVAAYADAAAAVKAAEAAKAAARETLLGLAGADTILHGRNHIITVATSARATLDTAAVRVVMGEAWCALHSKTSDITTLKVTAL